MNKVFVKRSDVRPFFDRHKDHPGGEVRIETEEPVEVALTPHIVMAIRRGRLLLIEPDPAPPPAPPHLESKMERGEESMPSAPRRKGKVPYLAESLGTSPPAPLPRAERGAEEEGE